MDMQHRVKAGARLLDSEYPQWHAAIDLDQLSMASTYSCVLGQLYGDYENGLERLDLNNDDPPERTCYGFTGPDDDQWTLMTDLWRDEITKRKEA